MAVTIDDVKYTKSRAVSDTVNNGGRKSNSEVISGVRHALFPRITKTERENGLTRYRKQFWTNENSDNDIAYGALQWLETISNAGDRFYLKGGTQTDIQGDITSPSVGEIILFTGTGQLNSLLSGGETEIILDMENNDFVFESGGYLHISDKVKTSQTIDSAVAVGDSVQYIVDTWMRVTSTTSITYPYGVYLDDNKVLTLEPTTNEEWVEIAERLRTAESVGTGTGTVSPALIPLSNSAMGVHQKSDMLPILETLDAGDTAMTMYFYADGTVDSTQGDGVSGELDMTDGTWTTNPTWVSAPKVAEAITCTYRENPYSYSSNTVTVYLATSVSNSYAVANTFAGGCVYADEVIASFDSWVETTVSGTYDEVTNPIVGHNVGAEEDSITITFTSGSTFNVSGTNLGSLGTGFLISADCIPTNPETGENMFTLKSAGWGGTWLSGETIEFDLHPSAQAIWLKEVVPVSTAQEPNNLIVLGWYTE